MNTFLEITEGMESAFPDHTREKRLAMIWLIVVALVATLNAMLPERLGAMARLIGMLGVPLLFVTWYEYRRRERGGSIGMLMKILIVILGIALFRLYLVVIAAWFIP